MSANELLVETFKAALQGLLACPNSTNEDHLAIVGQAMAIASSSVTALKAATFEPAAKVTAVAEEPMGTSGKKPPRKE